jgi:hypothetical protein
MGLTNILLFIPFLLFSFVPNVLAVLVGLYVWDRWLKPRLR